MGVSGTADRTVPFPVGSNPRWRPVAILKKTSDGHISAMCHPIYFVFGSRLGFF